MPVSRPGNTWQYMQLFLMVTSEVGGRILLTSSVGTWDSTRLLPSKTTPQQRIILPGWVRGAPGRSASSGEITSSEQIHKVAQEVFLHPLLPLFSKTAYHFIHESKLQVLIVTKSMFHLRFGFQ